MANVDQVGCDRQTDGQTDSANSLQVCTRADDDEVEISATGCDSCCTHRASLDHVNDAQRQTTLHSTQQPASSSTFITTTTLFHDDLGQPVPER